MKRLSDVIALMVAVTVVGCSTSSTGTSAGCAALQPIPGGVYTGTKTDNSINLQLSPEGINYVNNNWQQLVGIIAPGGVLQVPIACTKYPNAPLIGDIYIADQGHGASGSPGRMDQSCDSNDDPAMVNVTVTNLALTARQPNFIDAQISVSIQTGNIYLDSDDRSLGECLYLSGVNANLNFDTTRNSPPSNSLKATLAFSINTKFDERLGITVASIDGTGVCGASGVSAAPYCLDATDLELNGDNNCGDVYLTLLDWNPIKSFVLQLLSPTLQSKVQGLIGTELCQACGTAGMPACPTGSSCVANVCTDTQSSACVPRFLGVEGRVNLGAATASFGVPADAALDLSIEAGATFSIDTQNALNIGTRGGLARVSTAPCVPPEAAPPLLAVTAPDFRGEAPPVTSTNPAYHMALSVSSPFLNLAFHEAQQGGALCLQLTTAEVGLINTGLFKTFLPSLGKLATRDGKDAPMMVVLRPQKPPTVTVGAGGDVPLITVAMPDLTIDFYAMFDDRYARLFSLTADISLPLSLTFSGCTSVTPAIGDLSSLITNIHTDNSEILAEDPTVLADLIPAVIGLAQPALASALSPLSLPSLGAFKLKVNAAKGLSNIAGTTTYNHIGLYATMLPVNAACATRVPRTSAQLIRGVIPPASAMKLTGKPLPLPQAVLAVSALGVEGTPEFAVRIDDGLWGMFHQVPGGQLIVANAGFLLQGTHKIEVEARVAEDPHGVSEPAGVEFLVDWTPPEVFFTADRAHDHLKLTAHDNVTPDAQLQYSYKLGTGAFSSFGPPRDIILSAIEQQGGLTAQVKDGSGNIGTAVWRVAVTSSRPNSNTVSGNQLSQTAAGCESVAGLSLLSLAALAMRLRRSRKLQPR